MSDLTGKVAFITGGGSGIGRGVCERLARDGADIFIADVDDEGAARTVDLVQQLGRHGANFHANVAVKAQLQAAAAQCVAQFGRLDIAVANAGIARGGPVLEMSLEDWQLQLDINLTGVFLTVQAVGQQMARLGHGGRIVCISSLAAENTGPGIWSYSATKVGVRMMVRGWAQELGPHGITVNAIGPGVIDTPLAAGLAGDPGGAIRTNLERVTPVGRVGRPSDIAGLVSFMAGGDGEFMSGSYVLMDGGLRDARGVIGAGQSADSAADAERMRHMAAGAARRERMSGWFEER